MKVTLQDGTEISINGTDDQVKRVLADLGVYYPDGVHYKSSTRGVIPISSMHTNHIKNAIRKKYQNWVTQLSSKTPTKDFINALRDGPGANDVTLLALTNELVRRINRGEE